MAKRSKLTTALDVYMGKNYELEKQKNLQKKAEKKRKAKHEPQSLEHVNEHEEESKLNDDITAPEKDSDGWEKDKSEDAPTAVSQEHVLHLFHEFCHRLL